MADKNCRDPSSRGMNNLLMLFVLAVAAVLVLVGLSQMAWGIDSTVTLYFWLFVIGLIVGIVDLLMILKAYKTPMCK